MFSVFSDRFCVHPAPDPIRIQTQALVVTVTVQLPTICTHLRAQSRHHDDGNMGECRITKKKWLSGMGVGTL